MLCGHILVLWTSFYLFTPSGQDCGLNTFFIVMILILVFVFAVITLHPTVSGSILPASVISLYCMYLCYSGLASEPRDYACNGLHNHSKAVSPAHLLSGCSQLCSLSFTLLFGRSFYDSAFPSKLTSCR
ncbi:putative serine incorporator/TMS membrane protein [Helianthus annuus]|nr:putative serine incorporator/TMS membrane protein [Helianthus annuus]